MSLALAKKSLSLIDSTSATSKTKKSKNKRKNTFKQNHQQELSADSRTEDVVQRLLAYNNTNFDENVAKKILRNITKRAPKKFRKANETSSSNKKEKESASVFTEEDFKNFEEEYKLLMANETS